MVVAERMVSFTYFLDTYFRLKDALFGCFMVNLDELINSQVYLKIFKANLTVKNIYLKINDHTLVN
jgi:hypothetical protein